ncbi:hypothetical protein FIBSPDRAFT_721620, partial [Athelia psychrophila]
MPNEDAFKLNRTPKATRRDTDPFSEERVQEILAKVTVGADLTEDQKCRVTELITEFADVFALSLSEVHTVDWFKHKLNLDPNVKLPRRTGQRPITGAQKDWFFTILDEMEEACVIQKV